MAKSLSVKSMDQEMYIIALSIASTHIGEYLEIIN
jgi:hypothetical protein